MTDEQLDALGKKWEQAYDGKDVCDLIAEIRAMRSLFEVQPPWSPDNPVMPLVARTEDQLRTYDGMNCPQCLRDGLSVCQHLPNVEGVPV